MLVSIRICLHVNCTNYSRMRVFYVQNIWTVVCSSTLLFHDRLLIFVAFSPSGGRPGTLSVRAVLALLGSSGNVFALHQRGGNSGTCPYSHWAQRSSNGEAELNHYHLI